MNTAGKTRIIFPSVQASWPAGTSGAPNSLTIGAMIVEDFGEQTIDGNEIKIVADTAPKTPTITQVKNGLEMIRDLIAESIPVMITAANAIKENTRQQAELDATHTLKVEEMLRPKAPPEKERV